MDRALPVRVQRGAISGTLQVLTLSTTIALFALIIYGGVVRLTDSGLGCPDWPLCHGNVIPSTDSATLIEYFHRLFASITGLMVVATAIIVWRNYRLERYLFVSVMLALFLLVIQIILGAATVRTDLEPGLVMAHLAVAEAILACMILATIVAWREVLPDSLNSQGFVEKQPQILPRTHRGDRHLRLADNRRLCAGIGCHRSLRRFVAPVSRRATS